LSSIRVFSKVAGVCTRYCCRTKKTVPSRGIRRKYLLRGKLRLSKEGPYYLRRKVRKNRPRTTLSFRTRTTLLRYPPCLRIETEERGAIRNYPYTPIPNETRIGRCFGYTAFYRSKERNIEIRHRLRLEEREEYRESLTLYRKPRAALSIENRGPTLPNPESLALYRNREPCSLSIEI
jgi:hypothetical protein